MKSKGIIYKVTNVETGLNYIGVSTKSISERQKDHIGKAERGGNAKFQKAIATYGPQAFVWSTIDTAQTVNELAEKERAYILKYDCKTNGYNSDIGGGLQKTVYQYSLEDGKLINTFPSLYCAANAVNADKRNISKAAIGNANSSAGYFWSYSPSPTLRQDLRKKKVIQLHLDGVEVCKFNSISEASFKTGINKSSIAKVCRGERKLAGGYLWRYFL